MADPGATPDIVKGDDHRAALLRTLASIRAAKAPLDAAEAEILGALGLPAPAPSMIPVKAAAVDWGVSDDTVVRWAREGSIQAEQTVGGRWFVQAERPVRAVMRNLRSEPHRDR